MESGTNPTAAAVAFLASCGPLDESVAGEAARFVLAMQREDGGFAAHRAAPAPDLMSTFTSLVTLAELGAGRQVHLAQVARYIRNLLAPGGGFRATADDDTPDQEYTYFGLAALGLLSCERASPSCRTRPREMSSP